MAKGGSSVGVSKGSGRAGGIGTGRVGAGTAAKGGGKAFGGPSVEGGMFGGPYASAFSSRGLAEFGKASSLGKTETTARGLKSAIAAQKLTSLTGESVVRTVGLGDKARVNTVNGLSPDKTPTTNPATHKNTNITDRRTNYLRLPKFDARVHFDPNNVYVPETAPRRTAAPENTVIIKQGGRYGLPVETGRLAKTTTPDRTKAIVAEIGREYAKSRRIDIRPQAKPIGDIPAPEISVRQPERSTQQQIAEQDPEVRVQDSTAADTASGDKTRISELRTALQRIDVRTDKKSALTQREPEITSIPGLEVITDKVKTFDSADKQKNSHVHQKIRNASSILRERVKRKADPEDEQEVKASTLKKLTERLKTKQKQFAEVLQRARSTVKSTRAQAAEVQFEPLRIIQEAERTLEQHRTAVTQLSRTTEVIQPKTIDSVTVAMNRQAVDRVAGQAAATMQALETQVKPQIARRASATEATPRKARPTNKPPEDTQLPEDYKLTVDEAAAAERIKQGIRSIQESETVDKHDIIHGYDIAARMDIYSYRAKSDILKRGRLTHRIDGSIAPTLDNVRRLHYVGRQEAADAIVNIVRSTPPVAEASSGEQVSETDVRRVIQGEIVLFQTA